MSGILGNFPGGGEYVTPEVTENTTLIEQIFAALGGHGGEVAVMTALTTADGLYLTVNKEEQ